MVTEVTFAFSHFPVQAIDAFAHLQLIIGQAQVAVKFNL
jgi:hypothetical protein